jgi:diguanylate cyclase (GGDEF)-like protein
MHDMTDGSGDLPRPRSRSAEQSGAGDVLVFQSDHDVFRLIGGIGRGAGWADVVIVRPSDEPLVDRAWRTGALVRSVSSNPVRIVGPYWARFAAIVPVGHAHLAVFGGEGSLSPSDAVLVSAAADIVAATHHVSAEKLLADELEVVHAIRALTAYRPENVRDTARHIAVAVARALSCDVAAIQVGNGAARQLEVVKLVQDEVDPDPRHAGPEAGPFLAEAAHLAAPRVEQTVPPQPRIWTEEIVSRMTLPIGVDNRLGALALGHAVARPRGFTMLCQRIGRALADSADMLLTQAIAREQLAAEHALLRRASSTDPLTGVGNRIAWEDAVTHLRNAPPAERTQYAVLSIDLDDLKSINDRYGHQTGDSVIRAAANLLRGSLRAGDVVTRVGGDEFLVLLPNADEAATRAVRKRIARSLDSWRVTEHGLKPELSVGWALSDDDLHTAISKADDRMYAAKRRRRARLGSHAKAEKGPVLSTAGGNDVIGRSPSRT